MTRVRLGQAVELESQGRSGAKAARRAVEHIDAYLAACQLGITIASIGLGALAESRRFKISVTLTWSNPPTDFTAPRT